MLVIMLDLQNVEISLVGRDSLRFICGDDTNNFVMHVSSYLKLCSCINKIEKFARKYSVKCLFSHFAWFTECLNLTWLVKKLGFVCGIIFAMHVRN